MNAQTCYIAQKGHKGALILSVLFVISLVFSFETLAWLFFFFLLFWCFMFRNPERLATHLSANAFLSPIDGVVQEISADGNKSIITIKVGILDVGVLRAPVSIIQYELSSTQGVPLLFSNAKSHFSPCTLLAFGNHSMQITQDLFHFSPIDSKTDFERGERMGFLKAGNIKLVIENIELKLNVGDKIRSGESVIGYLQ